MKNRLIYAIMAFFLALTATAQSAYVPPVSSLQTSSTSTVQPTSSVINVGVMLPLHNVDGDGRRMVEYYRGMLLAINQLKQEGKNINVHAWNLDIETDPRTALLEEGASSCNIIIGPLYTKQVKTLGDFCKSYNIQMVIPFSISGYDVDSNPCIYQVYESREEISAAAVKHVIENFRNFHPVFIDCNDSTSKKATFTFPLRKQLEAQGTQYSITNLKSTPEFFGKAFSSTKPNLVILNTARSPEMRAAMDKLDALTQTRTDISISIYGYTEWLMYTQYNKERFCKYNTYVPSNFYYNPQSTATQQFVKNYKEAYGEGMMNALPHFALTGYDHAMYFIGKKFQWVQTPLKFQKVPDGGYRNKTFMLVHYKNDGNVDTILY